MGFSAESVVSTRKRERFISSLPIWLLLFLFLLLTPVAMTSYPMINRGVESEHPWLFLNVAGRLPAFQCGVIILSVHPKWLLLYPLWWELLFMNGCWISSNAILCLLRWSCNFWLFLCNVCVTLIYLCWSILVTLDQFQHELVNHLMYFRIQFANILSRIFAPLFINECSIFFFWHWFWLVLLSW